MAGRGGGSAALLRVKGMAAKGASGSRATSDSATPARAHTSATVGGLKVTVRSCSGSAQRILLVDLPLRGAKALFEALGSCCGYAQSRA